MTLSPSGKGAAPSSLWCLASRQHPFAPRPQVSPAPSWLSRDALNCLLLPPTLASEAPGPWGPQRTFPRLPRRSGKGSLRYKCTNGTPREACRRASWGLMGPARRGLPGSPPGGRLGCRGMEHETGRPRGAMGGSPLSYAIPAMPCRLKADWDGWGDLRASAGPIGGG